MHSCRTWPRYFSALLPGRVSCFPLQQQPRGAFVKSKNVEDFTVITVSCRRTTHASAPAVRTAMALRTSLDCCQVFVANWKNRVRSVGVVKVSRCTCGIFNNKGLEEASPHTLPTSKDTLDQGVFIPFLRPGWEIKELKFFSASTHNTSQSILSLHHRNEDGGVTRLSSEASCSLHNLPPSGPHP